MRHTEDSFEFRVGLTLFYHGEVVAKGAEARLELVVVEAAALLLVEVLEHHRELLERVFAHSRLVARLDLLLQVVLHSHAQLVQLIPLLCQAHSTETRLEI